MKVYLYSGPQEAEADDQIVYQDLRELLDDITVAIQEAEALWDERSDLPLSFQVVINNMSAQEMADLSGEE